MTRPYRYLTPDERAEYARLTPNRSAPPPRRISRFAALLVTVAGLFGSMFI